MNRSNYCSCCGALRGLSARNQAYNLHDIVPVEPHRPMQRDDGRVFEMSPQLIVHIGVYRNGGGASTDEHICNDCLMVGIRHALEALQKIAPPAPASQPAAPATTTVAAPEDWRELAAKVMDALADAQEQTNATCPEHVKCYPSWVSKARWLRWHADMFRTGKPVGNGAGQPAVLAALAAQQAADSVLEDAARLWDAFVDEWCNEVGVDKIVNIMGGADKLKAVFLDAARKQGANHD